MSNTRRIYKYEVRMVDRFTISLPAGAELLDVQNQFGTPQLWALVDPSASSSERTFRLAGTGHPIDESDGLFYVGSFQMQGGALVFHLFEVLS